MLITSPNFRAEGATPRQPYTLGDRFYEQLIDAHRDLSDEASRQLDARLVLLLANHVGDLAVLQQALVAARAGMSTAEPSPEGAAP
jgi:hypothetical protein